MGLYPEPWLFLRQSPKFIGPLLVLAMCNPFFCHSEDLPLCEAPNGEHMASPEDVTAVKCPEFRKLFSFCNFSALCVDPQCVLSS